jgi:hypothetical protein
MRTETQISRQIGKALDKLGIKHIRIQSGTLPMSSGSRFVHCAEPGTPDRVLPGLGWIEVKKPGGKLSDAQRRWKAWAEANGVNYIAVDNVADGVAAALVWRWRGGKA